MTLETARPDIVVVTADNFDAHVSSVLAPAAESETPDPLEEQAKEALAELEKTRQPESKDEQKEVAPEPKQGEIDGSKVFFNGQWVSKQNFEYRVWLKGNQIEESKAAELKAAKEDARKAREEREEAARQAEELRAKYEPPKSDEIGPEPQPEQFTNNAEFAKALKGWTAEATRKEDAAKASKAAQEAERAKVVKEWKERETAYKAENPEYEERLAQSNVRVSDPVRDAILESEQGPAILDHFAQHPDVAEAIGKLTVGRALKELGKLEVALAKPKEETKTSIAELAEVSKAPAPITPIKNANSPVVRLRGSDPVPKGLTYDDWKRLYNAGKIQ